MLSKLRFVVSAENVPSKRPKKLPAKELDKTIYYEEQNMEVFYV